MAVYPKVVGEVETLRLVLGGKSIARFGDGEMKIAAGGSCVSQEKDPALARELCRILQAPAPACLVGIPTMDRKGPKYEKWARYEKVYPKLLSPAVTYHSAFITRPDSAPWIDTKEFFDDVESLWRGRTVTLVGCFERSLKPEFLLETGAKAVHSIECPRRDAYRVIDDLEARCLKVSGHSGVIRPVLLCAGPAATCLANRLSRKGVHAVDLGHIGMFWRRYDG